MAAIGAVNASLRDHSAALGTMYRAGIGLGCTIRLILLIHIISPSDKGYPFIYE